MLQLSDIFYKLLENPYNISIACLFSIIERVIKTVFIIETVDTMLLANNNSLDNNFTYALHCSILLSIRYIFASNRHIFSYKASIEIRNNVLQHYHKLWLNTPLHLSSNYYNRYIDIISNKIKELISRIAIDFIPGIISIGVSIYTLYTIIPFPFNYYSFLYLFSIECLYYLCSCNYTNKQDALNIIKTKESNKVYSISADTLYNSETVHIYDRINYEISRLRSGLIQLYDKEIQYIKMQNYQDSFLHWLIHLVNGGILCLTRGKFSDNSKCIVLLYNVNELRSGINELRIFYRYYYTTNTILEDVNKGILPESHRKTNYSTDNLVLNNIHFKFNHNIIFENLCITFKKGSITAILGENGSGKTTLFRLLMGKYKDYSGTIISFKKENILLCEQKPQLFTCESIAYNIAYGCKSILTNKIDITEDTYIKDNFSNYSLAVQEAVRLMDIKYLENLDIGTLSGGEKQKISIARVLAKAIDRPNEIKLLLLDEWDTALDYKSRKTAYTVIQYIRKITNCITIFITHTKYNDYLFYNECDAIILEKGNIAQKGSFKSIWPKYVE